MSIRLHGWKWRPLGVALASLALAWTGAAGTPAADAATVSVAAVGDIACQTSTPPINPATGLPNPLPSCLNGAKGTSDLVLGAGYDAALMLGDLQYQCASTLELTNGYDRTWGRPAIKAITKPSPGNHEYYKNRGIGECDATGRALPYFQYFSTGANLPPDATDPEKGYYSFDIGDWHFISLNTGENCAYVKCDANSEQVRWLKQDLAAHQNVCTLAYFHYPRFSSNTPTSFTQPFWDALYAGGADVVLGGHVHHYERFSPQNPQGQADPAFGLHQFNIGSGGISRESIDRDEIDPTDPRWDPLAPAPQYAFAMNSAAQNDTHFGIVKFTLRESDFSWQFTDTGRTVRDSGSANCHGKPGNADTTPPTVSVTAPASGATVSGTVNVNARANDNRGIDSVEFQLDDRRLAIDTTAPYSVALNTRTLANGPHSLRAIAQDTSGNRTTSTAIAVTVVNDTRPPTVTITSPAANAIVAGRTDLNATAADDSGGSGIRDVEFLIDGQRVALDATAPYTTSWNSAGVSDGTHTLTVRAADRGGNTTTATRQITVQNIQVAGPGSTSIATIALGATSPTVIARPVTGPLTDPAYSHRRTRIAWVSREGIVLANANGTSRTLVPGTAGARSPGWGVGDTAIVFVKGGALYRVGTGGAGLRRLATGGITSASVSPNGRRILYQGLVKKRSDLFVIDLTGQNRSNVTKTSSVGEVNPTWRTNLIVAFSRKAPRKWAVYTRRLAGGPTTRVTPPVWNCKEPAFSPDGARLACTGTAAGGKTVIRTVRWNGKGAQGLRIPTSKPSRPSWGSNATVAYVTN